MPQFLHQHRPPGYVALISCIIISAVLIVIAVSVSTAGYLSRFNVADSEYKKRSNALAEACIDVALLKLANDSNYVLTPLDHDIHVIGTDTCGIFSLQRIIPNLGAVQIIIQSKAVFQHAVSNIQVIVNGSDLSLVSWEELPTL